VSGRAELPIHSKSIRGATGINCIWYLSLINIIELLCERTANDGRQVPGGTVAGETDSPVRQAHRGLWGEKDGIKRVFVLAE